MPSKWAPLESNPEVLTKWAGLVGLSTARVNFTDIYGLDEDVLAFVPQPVKAVLLVFPLSDEMSAAKKKTDEKIQQDGQPALDPTVFFVKQTISNACGTIALLHSIYNSDVTVKPNSPLQKFQQQSVDLTPDERAKLLETTNLFATAHEEAARGGQSSMPANLNTNEHFVAFVQAPDADPANPDSVKNRLIELDGTRATPIDHGEITVDLLRDAARIIKKEYVEKSTSLSFSMIALCPLST